MLLKIHTRGTASSDALSKYIDSKIRLALGLYKDKIRRVDIYLVDVNGPKGGEDISCKVKVSVDGYQPVIVRETDDDMYKAISISSHRIKRAVGRCFDRALQQRKNSLEVLRLPKEEKTPKAAISPR